MKNDTFVVEIEKIVSKGNGLAHYDGKAIFIPLTAPGDQVEIEIIESKKKYSIGKIKKIIVPSQYRTKPLCKYYGFCGGCDMQHFSDDFYAKIIFENLIDNLIRIGGVKNVNEIVSKPIMSTERFNYRVRGKFSFEFKNSKKKFGFKIKSANDVIDIDNCPLMNFNINEKFVLLKNQLLLFSQTPKSFIVDIYYLNKSAAIYKFQNRDENFFNFLSGLKIFDYIEIWVGEKLYFSSSKSFEMIYNNHRVSPGSFIQCNPQINKELRKLILNEITDSKNILDLYCGYGNFSLDLANIGKNVVGIEAYEKSANLLKKIPNYKIINNTVENGINEVLNIKFSTVMLDPPRKGAVSILKNIMNLKPGKILYISCDSATLSRDINILSSSYSLTKCIPLDMFSQTSHFETFAVLEKSF